MWFRLLEKIKEHQSDIILSAVIILITVISFQSGKISALKNREEAGIEIKEAPLGEVFKGAADNVGPLAGEAGLDNFKKIHIGIGTVIASKNSNKYHFSWCAGASKISDKNKITFPTEAAAIAAGLTLASNCKK